MKKLFFWALAGTMILAASCQREPQNLGSTAQGDDVKEVTTQFVLNVATNAQTKQSTDVVQLNQNFRGIEHAKLFCYKTGMSVPAGTVTPYVLQTTAPDAGDYKEFDLNILMSANSISNGDNDNDNNNDNLQNSSNRILQLSLPVGVDAVLMYGKALKPENGTDAVYGCTFDYDFRDSEKKNTISSTPYQTQFYAHPMLDNVTTAKYDATAEVMIAVINSILNTKVEAVASESFPNENPQVTFHNLPAMSWADYGHRYEFQKLGNKSRYTESQSAINHNLVGLEEILGQCYYLFTYIKASDVPYSPGSEEWKNYVNEHLGEASPLGEYRAGSSFAMKKMVIDTYKVISAAANAVPTTDDEACAARVAAQVLHHAMNFFTVPEGNYKSISVIKPTLVAEERWKTSWDAIEDMNLNNYPGSFNVPEGAAQLGFNKQTATSPDEFYYYHPNKPLVNPTMTAFEPRKYLYPAELWYYVNSPIRTTSADVTVADYPDGVTPWNTEASWTAKGWAANSAVASATRGVAVTNSLNYGVALLKSVITVGTSTLKDNRKALTDETEDRAIDVSKSHIKLTGVLVGGVNPRMNWQFTRYYTENNTPSTTNNLSLFDGVIFDSETGDPEISTATQIVNHTLVYDNYNSSEGANNQNDVYISLEFKNDGDAFWGRDNLIPQGGTFYLVGKVSKPSAEQITNLATKWPADHQIPPVYLGTESDFSGHFKGESRKIARVFIQDFTTTVTFTIGENSLKHAYYSVPDLRASQMSLGLSVDVQWIPGLDYAISL